MLETETWDLIDRLGNKCGITIKKGDSHPEGTYHLVVGIWVITLEAKALLTKRSQKETQYPGKWENTGGCVLAGETALAGAVRELKEETGIICTENALRHLGTLIERTAKVEIYGLIFDEKKYSLQIQSDEVDGVQWVDKATLETMILKDEVSEAAVRRMRAAERQLGLLGFS